MGYARSSDDGKQKYTGLQSFGWGERSFGIREGDERVDNITRIENVRKLIQTVAVPTLLWA